MRKMLRVMFVLMVIFTAAFSITAHAGAVNVSVTATEGWTNATYDPDTFVLTNVGEGYSFKMTNRNDAAATAYLENNGVQAATKIVIPSAVYYNNITYKIIILKSSILGVGNTLTEDVIISEGIPSIGTSGTGFTQVFYNAKGLKSISLPSTITSISNNSFMGCTKLTSIDIPEAVTTLGKQVFSGCTALTSIAFHGSNLTSIGDQCFEITKFTSINLPSSVKTLGVGVFLSSSELTEVVIPPLVTSIGNSMFNGAAKLISVTFKGNITTFGSTIFSNANKLNTITFEGNTAPTALTSFGTYTGTGITVNYPAAGTGYDVAAFTTFFPVGKTTYVPVGGTPVVTSCTISSVSATQDGYRVDFAITVANDVTSAVQYVALYNNDNLVAVKAVAANATSATFTTSQTVTKAKIFVWNNLINAKPHCFFAEKLILS